MRILAFPKIGSLFKWIFGATQLKQNPKYDIFQKSLFGTLASNMILGLDVVPIAAEQNF